jgi:GT2 family glycosyltransferase
MTAVVSIVLNWNRRTLTLECLAALAGSRVREDISHRILVVDNGSTDGSVEAIRATFPEVEVVALPQNVGYARGTNAGVRRALERGADWTLLVNNDAEVTPDTLAVLLEAAEAHGAGMVVPTIVTFDTPERVWPAAGHRRRLTLAAFDSTAAPPGAAPYDVDWVAACVVLVRAELWRDVGLFDERYLFYYEDHDLCLRAKRRGWRLLHVPAARARHHVAASTGVRSNRQLYLLARASVRYYLGHTRGAHRLFIVAYRLGSLVRTFAGAVLRGAPRAGIAYLVGLGHGLADVRAPHRPRMPEWHNTHPTAAS